MKMAKKQEVAMKNITMLMLAFIFLVSGCSRGGGAKLVVKEQDILDSDIQARKELSKLEADKIISKDIWRNKLVCSIKMNSNGSQRDIFMADLDGSQTTQLTSTKSYNASPKWLWGGKFIGYYSLPTQVTVLDLSGKIIKKFRFENRSFCEIFNDKIIFFANGKFYQIIDETLNLKELFEIPEANYELKAIFIKPEGVYFKITKKGNFGFSEKTECYFLNYSGESQRMEKEKFNNLMFES
ncbi:MAG: hypothetical protein KKA52_01735 [Candidatus Omnitrophica bacterium]|nr:hypothetical protein [Candidatus Omnitrophota bacterium]